MPVSPGWAFTPADVPLYNPWLLPAVVAHSYLGSPVIQLLLAPYAYTFGLPPLRIYIAQRYVVGHCWAQFPAVRWIAVERWAPLPFGCYVGPGSGRLLPRLVNSRTQLNTPCGWQVGSYLVVPG